MCPFFRAAFSVALVLPSIPAIAQNAPTPRRAEVLAMGQRIILAEGVPDSRDMNQANGFALLDLARNRVEQAMHAEMSRDTSALQDTQSGAAGLPPQARLAPFSSISVPGWMLRPMISVPSHALAFAPGCASVPYRPSGYLPADVETRRRTAYDAMSAAACEHGIPVGLFDALILSESAYSPTAVSPKNAYGLAQLMPDTAAGLGVDRFDPVQNLRGGARYLRAQLDSFRHVPLALAAYNAGPGRVKGGQIPAIPETRNYVSEVLAAWARLSGQPRTPSVRAFAEPQPVSSEETVRGAQVQSF